MKKNLLTVLILFALTTLTACGTSTAQAANSAGGNNGSANRNGNFSGTPTPLPLATELLIGTFKLEGTANAVTADEAAKLIPLWQVYKDLTASSSAAQQEIDALASQIQGTMTPEQVKAITDLKLTRRDEFQTMQDLGISFGNRPNVSGTPRPGGGNGGIPGGGGGPGGGGFPGGGGGGNGQNLSPQQLATLQARRAQNGGGNGQQFNRIPPALYDALIKLLQSKK